MVKKSLQLLILGRLRMLDIPEIFWILVDTDKNESRLDKLKSKVFLFSSD